MQYEHPFQNNGASSGICRVCGEPIVPKHVSVLLLTGVAVPIRFGEPDSGQKTAANEEARSE